MADKEHMTTFRLAVGHMIGPIRVRVASELIIGPSAAAKMQSNVSGGYEILENSFGGGKIAVQTSGIVSAKSSDCE